MQIIDCCKNLMADIDVKNNLLTIKQELNDKIKGTPNRNALLEFINNDGEVFCKLLSHEDPKVRKNAASIIGVLIPDNCEEALFKAYLKEDILYARASYLSALYEYDYEEYVEELKAIRNKLTSGEIDASEIKHYAEEIKAINLLLEPYDEVVTHSFNGFDLTNECCLLTNRNFKNITAAKLKGIPHKEYTAGVMVKTKNLKDVLPVRTYSELLFIPGNLNRLPAEPDALVKRLMDADILTYISERHSGQPWPMRFRIDIKMRDEKKRNILIHRISDSLEAATRWKLVNNPNDYEMELRFIEGAEGYFAATVDFRTLPDYRFNYRKKTISAGIRPYNAALLSELAGEYVSDDAVVLDPFCGSGIMLIEREKYKRTKELYGVDIFGEAILAATENITAAGLINKTNLITRDFFDFTYEHKFTEVFTDMPFVTDKKNENLIADIYRRFFEKIPRLLAENSYVFIYSRNQELVRRHISSKLKLVKAFEISKAEGSYFFVLKTN